MRVGLGVTVGLRVRVGGVVGMGVGSGVLVGVVVEVSTMKGTGIAVGSVAPVAAEVCVEVGDGSGVTPRETVGIGVCVGERVASAAVTGASVAIVGAGVAAPVAWFCPGGSSGGAGCSPPQAKMAIRAGKMASSNTAVCPYLATLNMPGLILNIANLDYVQSTEPILCESLFRCLGVTLNRQVHPRSPAARSTTN